MRNKEIEKIVGTAFERVNPNLFSKIVEKCPAFEESSNRSTIWNKITERLKSRKFAYSFSSFLLILSFSLIWFNRANPTSQNVYSIIAIDVNPSVVLELNDKDKVINVIKNNVDAVIIIGNMDLIDVDYNIALNAIVGSMVMNGYLNEFTNSVLISIKSNDLLHESEIKTKATETVNNTLNLSSILGSIITQDFTDDDNIKELAERLGISEAKAELINEITLLDPRVIAEDLAKLSINDLNLFLESKNYILNDVSKVGNASGMGNISPELAYELALAELNLDVNNVNEVEIHLEQEDGILVYEFKIKTAVEKYEVLVDAKKGTIIYDDNDEETYFPTDAFTEEEVMVIVLEVLGINRSEITNLEFENEIDNGIAFYNIHFDYQGEEYELDVNASTGLILTNSKEEAGFDYEEDESDDEDQSEEDDD